MDVLGSLGARGGLIFGPGDEEEEEEDTPVVSSDITQSH